MRAGDSAARIGGEEFAIILPGTPLDRASLIARRVQDLLATGEAGLPGLTLSIGIARLDTTTKNWEALLAQADYAMYEAKQTGKNRFVIYEAQQVA